MIKSKDIRFFYSYLWCPFIFEGFRRSCQLLGSESNKSHTPYKNPASKSDWTMNQSGHIRKLAKPFSTAVDSLMSTTLTPGVQIGCSACAFDCFGSYTIMNPTF